MEVVINELAKKKLDAKDLKDKYLRVYFRPAG